MKEDRVYLKNALDCIKDIEKYLADFNFEDFSNSDMPQDAVLMKILVLGEEINKISENLKEKYPKIEWRKIVGTRNIIAHGYYKVKADIIWKTYQEDLPLLKIKIQEILNNLN